MVEPGCVGMELASQSVFGQLGEKFFASGKTYRIAVVGTQSGDGLFNRSIEGRCRQ